MDCGLFCLRPTMSVASGNISHDGQAAVATFRDCKGRESDSSKQRKYSLVVKSRVAYSLSCIGVLLETCDNNWAETKFTNVHRTKL